MVAAATLAFGLSGCAGTVGGALPAGAPSPADRPVPGYCQPLASALAVDAAHPGTSPDAQRARVGAGVALRAAANSAAADANTPIWEMLTFLATMSTDPRSLSAQQASVGLSKVRTQAPVVFADCHLNLLG